MEKNNDQKLNATKNIFKDIYGILISTKYPELNDEDIVRIALGAIEQFAKNNAIITK
jgi:hypothetical protein